MSLYYIKMCHHEDFNLYFPKQLKILHGIIEAQPIDNTTLRIFDTIEYLKYASRWYVSKRKTILLTKQNYRLILRGKKFPRGTLMYIVRRVNDT